MTAPEIDRLLTKARSGQLTQLEQVKLAELADEYRNHSLRLERWVHDSIKKLEGK